MSPPFRFSPKDYDQVLGLARQIEKMAQLEVRPTVGIICGSGLGDLADLVQRPTVLPFAQIPGFPTPHGEPRGF